MFKTGVMKNSSYASIWSAYSNLQQYLRTMIWYSVIKVIDTEPVSYFSTFYAFPDPE